MSKKKEIAVGDFKDEHYILTPLINAEIEQSKETKELVVK